VSDGGVRIVVAGVDRIAEVEPLTRSLHAHHLTVDPAIPGIPPRDEDAWWSIRRARYEAWLAEPDTFLLIAEGGDGLDGYALVTFHGTDDSHATGDRFAELQSLVVAPGRRGEGVGTELLHEVYRQVRARDVEEMVIGVLATNERAMQLYRREGFRPWVVLTLGKVPDVADA
jgi:ribosomal protein S18 acetylase RimI-like enzyme